ncbi:hypothetical protein NO976_00076 [Planktothrix agardhii]|jgi:hypothetical protein|uniref:Uncharacterized protein n=1 Tax=Planktothrix agardhii TaxID=1160 RepID=A0AAD1Q0F2_PLAAG|nr:hypothetical protein NIVACYA_00320 [Planktothrix agardhii]BBD54063.1 hypothetical protein NIES204_13500 [Planktothrix agardhii NIES-204]CAD5911521.1 hypothetical protein NO976_00076 [Planktothrix agardhii]CAD5923488.1 hypothetical protein PANO66_00848 [Planktothrix agardhii]CAD5927657.1 hypothetical protein NO2A_01524 [Planktothrix agardhii]
MANPEYLALLQWGSQRWQISLKLIFPLIWCTCLYRDV